jgi:ATP-dependent RNA helicase DeaD
VKRPLEPPADRADAAPERPALAEIALADLPEPLQRAAAREGWTALMPVQAKAIPYLRAGRDVMVQSRTGSGKTGAFVLPILERIDPKRPACQALVLVPTRELARQVEEAAQALALGTGVRVVPLYGGVGYGPQLEGLRAGAHLVVGTPGRILDHLQRGTLSLDSLAILVFDEADRMLSMGFYPDMVELARWLPDQRDGFMFSATYPASVLSLARRFLHDPDFLSLSRGHEHVAETEHVYYAVSRMEKDRGLVRIIEVENPESSIVFCNTKATVHYVGVVLKRFGYDAEPLSADLTQAQREAVMKRAYDRRLRFLVSTDLAGRGIDIESLSHVFLYDFPEDPESYIHRAGRTGRAGASGEAVSLVDPMELAELRRVARKYGIELVERKLPTDEDVQRVVAERVTALLEQKLRGLDRIVAERMQRMLPLARSLGDSDDERRVIAMLLDEYYHGTLHVPPVPREGEGEVEAGEPGRVEERKGRSGRRRGGRRRHRPGGSG